MNRTTLFKIHGFLLLALALVALASRASWLQADSPNLRGSNAAFAQPDPPKGKPPGKPIDDEDDDAGDIDPLVDADADDVVPPTKKLTPEQINRVRYLELRGMRLNTSVPDRVTVKISRDVIDEFLIDMEGHPDFRGKKKRKAFLKKTLPQKLHIIAHYRGADYAEKVQIKSDPEVFVNFRTQVMPTVLRGCSTSGCHLSSNKDAEGFTLFKDPKKTDVTTYTNFVLLNELRVNGDPLINRGQPENSLLLTYMLPRKEVRPEQRHPADIEYKPIFQSRKAPRFRRILKWIASLKHPAEDYGVYLIEEPAAEPGDEILDPPGDAPPKTGPDKGSGADKKTGGKNAAG